MPDKENCSVYKSYWKVLPILVAVMLSFSAWLYAEIKEVRLTVYERVETKLDKNMELTIRNGARIENIQKMLEKK